ncbi:MAG: ABC transporter ATP-binding protein [Pelobium sp.]
MIEVKQISKDFGKTKAVKALSFTVEKGETLILLGTSGCGKTTTLKMINRLINPDHGSIFINGKDSAAIQPEELRLGIGYVMQNHGLFPHYNIAQNIEIVPQLLKWKPDKITKRTDELMEKLHLPLTLKNKFPNELSGGQQQRIGLARALSANPPILLMDEPLGALDPITRNSIKQEFLSLDELQSKTIVMVTHDINEAFELGDRICLMSEGEVLQIGEPRDLMQKPVNKMVRDFFKGHQLQLSLKSIQLEKLWGFLNNHVNNHLETSPIKNLNVWDTLEQLAETGSTAFEYNGEVKNITSASLMQALENYKKERNGDK